MAQDLSSIEAACAQGASACVTRQRRSSIDAVTPEVVPVTV
jgi:hypothetical protein